MSERSCRGFSLFEFVVVIVVIAVLSGFLLTRVLPLIGQASRFKALCCSRRRSGSSAASPIP
jgi:prepilin-type N-terminal cleavage/methylation domain-containing protein